MSAQPPEHVPGQIVNGHVLALDGRWYRIEAPPPAPAPARDLQYDATSGLFHATLPQVMRLGMRAVQSLGWTVKDGNETLGLLVFETGVTWGSWSGVTGSITFIEEAPGAWRATGTGKQNVRGGQTLAIDFGEADGKVRKVIAEMARLA